MGIPAVEGCNWGLDLVFIDQCWHPIRFMYLKGGICLLSVISSLRFHSPCISHI